MNDCGVLPVLNGGGRLAGMITDRDIAVALATRSANAGGLRVGKAAAHEVFSCSPDDDVHSALKTMRRHKVRRLPVLDHSGNLAGILCMNDLVLHADHALTKETISYDDVVNTLEAISEHRHREEPAPAVLTPNTVPVLVAV